MTIVEPVLAFLQMQVEGMRRHAMKLLQAVFLHNSKRINAIDAARATSNLVSAVIDSIMFAVPNIKQTIVAAPTQSELRC